MEVYQSRDEAFEKLAVGIQAPAQKCVPFLAQITSRTHTGAMNNTDLRFW